MRGPLSPPNGRLYQLALLRSAALDLKMAATHDPKREVAQIVYDIANAAIVKGCDELTRADESTARNRAAIGLAIVALIAGLLVGLSI